MFSHLQVLILENVRFYKEETKNDPEFAKKVGWPRCKGLSDIMRTLDCGVPCPGAPGRLCPS